MLRQVKPKDHILLQQVDYDLSTDYIKGIVKSKKWWYLFEEGNEILGYVIYDLAAKQIKLERLFVDFHHRRRGIGTTIMYRLSEKLNDVRKCIHISVEDDNLIGHLFLKDLGFRAAVNSDDRSIYDFSYCKEQQLLLQG
jgi:GNAT superfamily N-acetyltransferase